MSAHQRIQSRGERKSILDPVKVEGRVVVGVRSAAAIYRAPPGWATPITPTAEAGDHGYEGTAPPDPVRRDFEWEGKRRRAEAPRGVGDGERQGGRRVEGTDGNSSHASASMEQRRR